MSLDIRTGETLGLVGESGCGKTTTLHPGARPRPADGGRVVVLGHDVATLGDKKERKAVRRDLSVVFQDPMAALDPRLPVFDVIAEPLRAHGVRQAEQVAKRVSELLRLVGLEPGHASRYPQAFSGGQRQRIVIARALALEPKLIVLDEPVAALDVSIQAGVINLLDELRARLGLSYLFVAHDLAVVRHIADRVAVMYLGRIVEIGDVDSVFDFPTAPVHAGAAVGDPDPRPGQGAQPAPDPATGDLPSPLERPSGCRFRTRCPKFLELDDTDRQDAASTRTRRSAATVHVAPRPRGRLPLRRRRAWSPDGVVRRHDRARTDWDDVDQTVTYASHGPSGRRGATGTVVRSQVVCPRESTEIAPRGRNA